MENQKHVHPFLEEKGKDLICDFFDPGKFHGKFALAAPLQKKKEQGSRVTLSYTWIWVENLHKEVK